MESKLNEDVEINGKCISVEHRAWLNKPNHMSSATVRVSADYFETRGGTITRKPGAMVDISDCNRSITLDFCPHEVSGPSMDNALHKLAVLREALDVVEAHLKGTFPLPKADT